MLLAAGCGSDSDKTDPGMQPDPGNGTQGQPPAPPAAPPMQLGQAASTAGEPGPSAVAPVPGDLELTPTNVAYVTGEGTLHLVVTIKQRATGTKPADAGPWKYTSTDGQAFTVVSSNPRMLYPKGFYDNGMPVQPGTFTWDTQSWDISEAQRGGTLSYTDGLDQVFSWTLPAQDTGPQVDEVKKSLR
jgi:hypothetical protein